MTTIQDLYKHVANKIANKVSDPWDDLWATIIPIDADGNFCKAISSMDKEEYEGDVYSLVRQLCFNTEVLPTHTYGFFSPGYKKDPDTGDRKGKMISFALVHDSMNIEYLLWDLDDNSVGDPFVDGNEEGYSGQLPIALGALSFMWDIDHDVETNELAKITKQLFESQKHTAELLAQAIKLSNEESNH